MSSEAVVHVYPLPLAHGSDPLGTDDVSAALGGADLPRGVLVLEATLLGPRHPRNRTVVEALTRGTVVAERSTPTGIRRVVATDTGSGAVELLDAGARPVRDGVGEVVAFPPMRPEECARDLAAAVGCPVVLTSRAGTSVAPVLLATTLRDLRLANAIAGTGLLVGADAAVVGLADVGAEADDGGDVPGPTQGSSWTDGRIEAVRSALGVQPGTPEALEAVIPEHGDDIENRVRRACTLAGRPMPRVPGRHPAEKHMRHTVDTSGVSFAVLQTGVRVSAPDDLTLGVAVGRLVVALAGEGVEATPVQHEASPAGSTALVAYLAGA